LTGFPRLIGMVCAAASSGKNSENSLRFMAHLPIASRTGGRGRPDAATVILTQLDQIAA
jgi:hypothetical protein